MRCLIRVYVCMPAAVSLRQSQRAVGLNVDENIFNFKSSFAISLTVLLEIPVNRWVSRNFLVGLPRSSSWLQINSDTRAMLAVVRAVRIRSGGLRFEVPVPSFLYQAIQCTSNPSSVRKLLNFNNLKRIKPLCRCKIRSRTRSSSVNGTILRH